MAVSVLPLPKPLPGRGPSRSRKDSRYPFHGGRVYHANSGAYIDVAFAGSDRFERAAEYQAEHAAACGGYVREDYPHVVRFDLVRIVNR